MRGKLQSIIIKFKKGVCCILSPFFGSFRIRTRTGTSRFLGTAFFIGYRVRNVILGVAESGPLSALVLTASIITGSSTSFLNLFAFIPAPTIGLFNWISKLAVSPRPGFQKIILKLGMGIGEIIPCATHNNCQGE
jgi:hypothetical protein